jgi:hypothetical protein
MRRTSFGCPVWVFDEDVIRLSYLLGFFVLSEDMLNEGFSAIDSAAGHEPAVSFLGASPGTMALSAGGFLKAGHWRPYREKLPG